MKAHIHLEYEKIHPIGIWGAEVANKKTILTIFLWIFYNRYCKFFVEFCWKTHQDSQNRSQGTLSCKKLSIKIQFRIFNVTSIQQWRHDLELSTSNSSASVWEILTLLCNSYFNIMIMSPTFIHNYRSTIAPLFYLILWWCKGFR